MGSSQQSIIYPQGKDNKPYLNVGLQDDSGKSHKYYSHRVILETFNGYNQTKIEVNHIDENRTTCNAIENLECVTPKVNMNHGTRTARQVETARKNGVYERLATFSKERLSKPCVQIKGDGTVVHWKSTKEAGRNGYNAAHVASCCRRNTKLKTHKGSQWFWLSDYESMQQKEAQQLELSFSE